jgi:hypothetical protein
VLFCTRGQTAHFSEEDWDRGCTSDDAAGAANDDGDVLDRIVNFIAAARAKSCSSTTFTQHYTKHKIERYKTSGQLQKS